jgi:hypothetical protein
MLMKRIAVTEMMRGIKKYNYDEILKQTGLEFAFFAISDIIL